MAIFLQRLRESFLSREKSIIRYGLVGLVWFGAFAHAAHDLWASSVVFAITTLLFVFFCVGRCLDGAAIRLPFFRPLGLLLAALYLSKWQAYDLDAFKLTFWGFVFSIGLFYLFLNVVRNLEERDHFFEGSGWIIPLILILCLKQLFALRSQVHPLVEVHATLLNSLLMAGFVLHWPIFFFSRRTAARRFLFLFWSAMLVLLLARSWWSGVSLAIGFVFYFRSPLGRFVGPDRRKWVLVSGVVCASIVLLIWLKYQLIFYN